MASPDRVVHVAAEAMQLTSQPIPSRWVPHDRRYDQPEHHYTVQLCARCGSVLHVGLVPAFRKGTLVVHEGPFSGMLLAPGVAPTCREVTR